MKTQEDPTVERETTGAICQIACEHATTLLGERPLDRLIKQELSGK